MYHGECSVRDTIIKFPGDFTSSNKRPEPAAKDPFQFCRHGNSNDVFTRKRIFYGDHIKRFQQTTAAVRCMCRNRAPAPEPSVREQQNRRQTSIVSIKRRLVCIAFFVFAVHAFIVIKHVNRIFFFFVISDNTGCEQNVIAKTGQQRSALLNNVRRKTIGRVLWLETTSRAHAKRTRV